MISPEGPPARRCGPQRCFSLAALNAGQQYGLEIAYKRNDAIVVVLVDDDDFHVSSILVSDGREQLCNLSCSPQGRNNQTKSWHGGGLVS